MSQGNKPLLRIPHSLRHYALRVYGPHFLIAPVILIEAILDLLPLPSSFQWLGMLHFLAVLGIAAAAWSASSVAVGKRLFGLSWLTWLIAFGKSAVPYLGWARRKLNEPVKEGSVEDSCLGCVSAVAGLFLALFVVGIFTSTPADPDAQVTTVPWTAWDRAVFWQGADLVLLTVSLLYNGAFSYRIPDGGAESVDARFRRATEEYEAAVAQIDALTALSDEDKETMKIKLQAQLEKKLKRISEGDDGNPVGN
jgi:hypothetical protein